MKEGLPDGFWESTRRSFVSAFPEEMRMFVEGFIDTHGICSLDTDWVSQNMQNPKYRNFLKNY